MKVLVQKNCKSIYINAPFVIENLRIIQISKICYFKNLYIMTFIKLFYDFCI
jgi:hypothetical protein